jgi:hypothetical protein
MSITTLMPLPKQQFLSALGVPLIGGNVYTYAAGTTNPKATYTDAAGTTPQPNPIPLNVRGEPANPIYWNGNYRVDVRDALGNLIYSVDNFNTDPAGLWSIFTTLLAQAGSSLIGFIQAGAGAIARTLQAKAREIEVSVNDYGADRTGAADSSDAIQAAIDYVFGRGGGIVAFDVGKYKTSKTITLRSNVRLVGRVGAYQPDTNSGVQIVASGNNLAVFEATNVLDVGMENIRVDGSALTGTFNVGVHLNGFWLSSFRRITVVGISAAKGYAVKCETGTNVGGASFGAQHNVFDLCEFPDGLMRFEGKTPSDQVTTTEVRTCRGFQYEIQHCQISFTNATAEAWTTGSGFYFYGSGNSTMIHCDIEGTGPVGITIGDTHVVREFQTIWVGYSGAQRYNGQPVPLGSGYQGTVTAGAYFPDFVSISDNNTTYLRAMVKADSIAGGAQEGHAEIRRRAPGGEILQFEWRNQIKVEHQKAVANAAVTIATIPVSTPGVRVKVTARGVQTGAGPFLVSAETVCVNNFGALAKTDSVPLAVQTGGSAGAVTFVISGTNLLVQCAHGSATATTISFIIEIDGDGAGYSKS